MNRGVGYTPPPGKVVYWSASRWGDGRDAGVTFPLMRAINLDEPLIPGNTPSVYRRYCAPDQIAATLNGPYILQGSLNTETGGASTAAAFTELQRRFSAGELGKPAEWDGWPTEQEMWDLVVSEWPPRAGRLPDWPEFQGQKPPTPDPPVVTPLPPTPPPPAPPPTPAAPPNIKPAEDRVADMLAWADERVKSAPASVRLSYAIIRRWPGLQGVLVELLLMIRTALRNAKERP